MQETDANLHNETPTDAKPTIKQFKAWLSETTTESSGGAYRHKKLTEDLITRSSILSEIVNYYKWAHRDAINWIRKALGEPLDPLNEEGYSEPIFDYPCNLKMIGQQGCFGEIFAGILAEHSHPFGESGWEVPAYLDRFHNTAFEELESRDPLAPVVRNAFGRTGDDCLAFLRIKNHITHVLYCEAKCSTKHDASLITEAHKKMSFGKPLNFMQLIDILQARGDAESENWVAPLRLARQNLRKSSPATQQLNLISYICGERPVRKDTWIESDKPHTEYKAAHRLEAVEIHLNEVENLIKAVYAKEVWS